MPTPKSHFSKDYDTSEKVLRKVNNWKSLHFYKKADTLFQLTFVFCRRFLPLHGDRTVDQMIQAARSGKQNIVEGSEDGKTSTEIEIKLINIARSSIGELREDYRDFLLSRNLDLWQQQEERFSRMIGFTRSHNLAEDYLPYAENWTAEEFANIALTLCHQTDTMINRYLQQLERTFVTEGGIKERMYAARTGYRKDHDILLSSLEAENKRLKAENQALQAKYLDLRERALKAYNALKLEIETLKKEKGGQG